MLVSRSLLTRIMFSLLILMGSYEPALGMVNVQDYSHLVRGDDWTAAIQAADKDLKDGGTLYFPAGRYIISSTIVKSPFSNWLGDGGRIAKNRLNTGTDLILKFDGPMISMTLAAGEGAGNTYIRGFHALGGKFPKGRFLTINGGRQFLLEDLYITSFDVGISAKYVGELYVNRVFAAGNRISADFDSLSDTWIDNSHFAGLDGIGCRIINGDNLTVSGCRFHMTRNGDGLFLQGVKRARFIACIFDQNGRSGVRIINSQYLDFLVCDIFENGENDGGSAGVILDAQGVDISSINPVTNEIITKSDHYWGYLQTVRFYVPKENLLLKKLQRKEFYTVRSGRNRLKLVDSRKAAKEKRYVDLGELNGSGARIIGVTKSIHFQGGFIGDRYPSSADVRQLVGVVINNSGGHMEDVVFDSVDLSFNKFPTHVQKDFDNVVTFRDCRGINGSGLKNATTHQ